MDYDSQSKAVAFVKATKSRYLNMTQKRRDKLKEIYAETTSYESQKAAEWSSSLKVNFANQIESLVVARLTAKNPKFIVSLRQTADELAERYFKKVKTEDPEIQAEQDEALEEFKEQIREWGVAVQEYLNYAFDNYDFNPVVRQLAKSLVRYGNCYGTTDYKYEYYRTKKNGKVEEKVARAYPCIKNLSWTELLVDPRFVQTSESPGLIWRHERVSLSELYLYKDELVNLDQITSIGSTSMYNEDKQFVYQIKINTPDGEATELKVTTLNVDKYKGFYSPTGKPEDDKIYELWVVNDCLLVKYEEIPKINIYSAGCFEDPEQHYATGYIEPLLGLQREYNFKMNAAIEYINFNLNHSFFWDPNSGIDPRGLARASAPGAIIPVANGADNAFGGIKEIPKQPIDTAYFSNQNEVRRDIQSVTFTVDTTAPTSQQGFTNTATAVKARFFESNTVYADTLKHFEELLCKLAYDLLEQVARKSENDVIVQAIGSDKFKWIKPAVFDEAPIRYAIRVEIGSSSFDSIEQRREESLALMTVLERAAAAGANVDFDRAVQDIIEGGFEGKDSGKYIKQDMDQLMGMLGGAPQEPGMPQGLPTPGDMPEPVPSLSEPNALTQAVVGGDLTGLE